MVVNGNIYEGLTAIDKDLKIIPGLAESWTVSPDGKTYTFKLRSGREIPRRLRRWRRRTWWPPSSACRARTSPRRWQAASRRSRAPTRSMPQTVELKLKEPSAPLLASLATIAIVPSSMEAEQGCAAEDAGRHGPVQVHRNGSRTASSCSPSNDAYWEKGLPKLAGLKFNIVPESATRQVGLDQRPIRACCRTSMRRRPCSSRASRT